ncbi:MAG: hypothetical protein ACK5HO_00275 [Pseudomonadota bacterium]|jgi:hypothetical protein
MSAYVAKFQRVRPTASTDLTFPARTPTLTAPTGAGVLQDPIVGTQTPEWVQVVPFGDGADNSTFDLRVIGWKPTELGLWVPTLLAQAACTLSAALGVAATEVLNTQRFADTIALTQVLANVDSKLSSPANDTIASFQVETRGSVYLEILFDLGTATGANALVSWV